MTAGMGLAQVLGQRTGISFTSAKQTLGAQELQASRILPKVGIVMLKHNLLKLKALCLVKHGGEQHLQHMFTCLERCKHLVIHHLE